MVIDFHVHTFPENIAKEAIIKLKELSGFHPYSDGTEDSVSKQLKNGPVTHAVIWPIATNPENVESINRYNLNRNYSNLFFQGAMHPDYDNFEKELKFLKDNNINGVKLHTEFQDFKPNDKKLFSLYECIIKNNMFILFHTGKEDFLKRDPPNGQPKYFSQLHDLFPQLQIVLAHFGGHGYTEELEEYLFGKDVYIDLSYEIPFLDKSFITNFFSKHSEDLILYGSDSPWQDIQGYYKYFESLNLPFTTKEKIVNKNAMKLLS